MIAACGGGGSGSSDCQDGTTRSCYAGPPGTEGVGQCKAGIETCSGGRWPGICIGDVTPFVEKCNGLDDNCNGVVDDVSGSGDACTGSNGCEGETTCDGGMVRCVAPLRNECAVCGGDPVDGLGTTCEANGCAGAMACNGEGDGTVCSAPTQNECGVCGGPAVADLGTTCMGAGNCAGRLACDASGTAATCDCSEQLCNNNGTLRPIHAPQPGDLVITEVMPNPDQVADTAGEWFEVRAMTALDLNGLQLDRASDALAPVTITAFDCMPVAEGDYLVFARNADSTMNGGLPPVTATFNFALIDGTTANPGDVRVMYAGTVIDAITWTSTRVGKAHQLDPSKIDAIANDDPSNFCDAMTTYGDGDFGTPGQANPPCPLVAGPGECVDNGTTVRPIVKPAAGTLVITELMPRPAVGDNGPGEWFEITNVGTTAFDLNGLGLDRADDTRAPDVISANACRPLAPTAFALFARGADPSTNGGLPAVDATFGFGMLNTNGNVRVVDPASCDTTSPFACTTVYDVVAYTTTTVWPMFASAGESAQLKDDSFTTTANDVAANYCAGQQDYGSGGKGTPGAANDCP
jgi:hypothetical protein